MRTVGRLPGEQIHGEVIDAHRAASREAARWEGRDDPARWGSTTPRCQACLATATECVSTFTRTGVQCCDDCRDDQDSGIAKSLHALPPGGSVRAALYARVGQDDPLELREV